MKTKFAIAAIALALSSSAAFASLKDAASGNITINGFVENVSCNVGVNGTNNANGVVELPNIDVSEFAEVDTVYKQTPFTIEVKGCTSVGNRGGSLNVKWSAKDLANSEKGYLSNIVYSEAAKGVSIALLEDNGKVVIPGNSESFVTGAADQTTQTFQYKAGYVTENLKAVDTGRVNAVATYTISYE